MFIKVKIVSIKSNDNIAAYVLEALKDVESEFKIILLTDRFAKNCLPALTENELLRKFIENAEKIEKRHPFCFVFFRNDVSFRIPAQFDGYAKFNVLEYNFSEKFHTHFFKDLFNETSNRRPFCDTSFFAPKNREFPRKMNILPPSQCFPEKMSPAFHKEILSLLLCWGIQLDLGCSGREFPS